MLDLNSVAVLAIGPGHGQWVRRGRPGSLGRTHRSPWRPRPWCTRAGTKTRAEGPRRRSGKKTGSRIRPGSSACGNAACDNKRCIRRPPYAEWGMSWRCIRDGSATQGLEEGRAQCGSGSDIRRYNRERVERKEAHKEQ